VLTNRERKFVFGSFVLESIKRLVCGLILVPVPVARSESPPLKKSERQT
jgi:hypothetical protein